MLEPLARIALRYIALPLLLWLGLPQETAHDIITDPDIQLLLVMGFPVIGAAIEGWYMWARKKGRAT